MNTIDYLFSKISNTTPQGCWEWKGYRNENGYGQVRLKGLDERYVHRIFYKLKNKILPKDLFVCHHCDNPPCVNPDHLFLGTQKDNMQDCSKKNRFNNWNKKKTHCKNGHEFSKQNTHVRADGERVCRTCLRNQR